MFIFLCYQYSFISLGPLTKLNINFFFYLINGFIFPVQLFAEKFLIGPGIQLSGVRLLML